MKSLSFVSPASALPLVAHFDRQVRLRGSRTAVESARLSLTYAALDARADRLAQVLREADVQRGERICILSENDPDFIVLCIAALRLGATVATLNPRLAVGELRHCIQLVTPKVILVSPRQGARFDNLRQFNAKVLEMGDGTSLDRRLAGGAEAESASDGRRALVTSDPEDVQFIIYTSGTTGLPKAAMISQRAMWARLMVYVLDYGVDGNDAFLAWSPLCHMASVELGFGTLLLGGKVVVLDGPDLPVICDHLENEPLSNLIFFPGMVEQAIEYLKQRRPRVRSLKKFGALADLFSPRDIAQLTGLLDTPFTNTFGSTETGMPPLSAGRLAVGEVPSDFGKVQSSMCEVRLFDADDRESPVGEVGELAVRGPTLFSGYWGAEAATQEALRDGWFRTGDMFRRRHDERFDYVDRRKYLIKSGGENIYPAEIENLLYAHPSIAEVSVVGAADPRWGERVVAFVVLRPGQTLDLEQLQAFAGERLARYKLPRELRLLDALPRNSNGKVLKTDLRGLCA